MGRTPRLDLDSLTADTLDARRDDGETPLTAALRDAELEAVRALLARGADVHATAGSGETPLAAAIGAEFTAAIPLLLDAGADPGGVLAELLELCGMELEVILRLVRRDPAGAAALWEAQAGIVIDWGTDEAVRQWFLADAPSRSVNFRDRRMSWLEALISVQQWETAEWIVAREPGQVEREILAGCGEAPYSLILALLRAGADPDVVVDSERGAGQTLLEYVWAGEDAETAMVLIVFGARLPAALADEPEPRCVTRGRHLAELRARARAALGLSERACESHARALGAARLTDLARAEKARPRTPPLDWAPGIMDALYEHREQLALTIPEVVDRIAAGPGKPWPWLDGVTELTVQRRGRGGPIRLLVRSTAARIRVLALSLQ